MWASGVVRGYNKYEGMLGNGVELHSSSVRTNSLINTCTVVYCVLVQHSVVLEQAALHSINRLELYELDYVINTKNK